MYSRQPTSLVISRHYCYKKFILLNDDSLKNFRESYVFHCLVIKVLIHCRLWHLVHFITFIFVCQELFSSFLKLFNESFVIRYSSATRLLYHIHFWMSSTFLKFFIFKIKNLKRRRRDLNPRAGHPTYTLSRGTSSASWVLLLTPNS